MFDLFVLDALYAEILTLRLRTQSKLHDS